MYSKKEGAESRMGSHLDQISDTTSEERQRRKIDNIDFIKVEKDDGEAEDSQSMGVGATPKSAHVKIKPIF